MKTLLIFPPQAHPANPYLSLPLLAGQLKSVGESVSCFDLNVSFFNDVFTESFMANKIKMLKNLQKKLEKDKLKPYEVKQKEKIDKILLNPEKLNKLVKYIECAANVYKTEDFFNPNKLFKAIKVMSFALEILSLCYYPYSISIGEDINTYFSYSWNDIIAQVSNRNINPFIDYYNDKLDCIDFSKFDLIGISVPFPVQIVPSLTLVKYLKTKTNAKILLGGNLISRVDNIVDKHPDILSDYCDFILSGDSEISIINLVHAMEGKISFENVKGLIYKDEKGNLCKNARDQIINFEKISIPDFSDYNFKDYFIPSVVMPIQASKGCYWGKCTFCDFFFGKPYYYVKSPKNLVSEMIYLMHKYKIRKFEFTDEAISPSYYNELADEIINNNLDIAFFSMARLEEEFTPELLFKLHKAGVKLINWGYEATSERIMKEMNKGINSKKRLEILKNSSDVGIWNRTSFIIGFPTETSDEAMLTVNTVKKNINIMDSYNVLVFKLRRHASITNNQAQYDLLSEDCNDFLDEFLYKDKVMSNQDKDYYRKLLIDAYSDNNKLRLWKILMPNAYLISYIDRYGKNRVRDYRL